MLASNRFVFKLNQRLQHVPTSKRLNMIQKIMEDLEPTGILNPIDFEEEILEHSSISFNNILGREDRIINLEKKHGTFNRDVYEEDNEQKRISRSRCGGSDMHDAVKMGDIDLIKRIYKSDPSSMEQKNNNGHTPIYVAFLEENKEVINAFREMKLIPGSMPN